MRRRGSERGQTTLLIVGLAVTLMMAVAVVVDASAAFLQRQGLDNLADGAALYGADAGATGEDVYTGGVDERLAQFEATARAGVAEYMTSTGAGRSFPGVTWAVRVDSAGRRVVVDVRAPLDLPLTVPGSPHRASIGATGSAVVASGAG